MRVLSQNITEKDILDFTDATKHIVEQGQRNYVHAIYQISVLANMEAFEIIKRRYPEVCESLKILMKPEFDEAMQHGKKDLFSVIMRIKNGATESILLEEGFSLEDIKLAIAALE